MRSLLYNLVIFTGLLTTTTLIFTIAFHNGMVYEHCRLSAVQQNNDYYTNCNRYSILLTSKTLDNYNDASTECTTCMNSQISGSLDHVTECSTLCHTATGLQKQYVDERNKYFIECYTSIISSFKPEMICQNYSFYELIKETAPIDLQLTKYIKI